MKWKNYFWLPLSYTKQTQINEIQMTNKNTNEYYGNDNQIFLQLPAVSF